MKSTTYIDIPDRCIFLSPIEWSTIERDIEKDTLAKYAQSGYPRIELENGNSYIYLPLTIGQYTYKVIRGNRPIKSVDEDFESSDE